MTQEELIQLIQNRFGDFKYSKREIERNGETNVEVKVELSVTLRVEGPPSDIDELHNHIFNQVKRINDE